MGTPSAKGSSRYLPRLVPGRTQRQAGRQARRAAAAAAQQQFVVPDKGFCFAYRLDSHLAGTLINVSLCPRSPLSTLIVLDVSSRFKSIFPLSICVPRHFSLSLSPFSPCLISIAVRPNESIISLFNEFKSDEQSLLSRCLFSLPLLREALSVRLRRAEEASAGAREAGKRLMNMEIQM